jgi:hypothetical protein
MKNINETFEDNEMADMEFNKKALSWHDFIYAKCGKRPKVKQDG